jgi:hypothetical protein
MQEYNVFEMITADQRPNWHLYIDAKKKEGYNVFICDKSGEESLFL